MGVRDFALSVRQLDHWLAGGVATLPRPSLCRVVEAEFGYPVERLLAVGGDSVEASSTPRAQPMAAATGRLEHMRRGLHEVLAGGALREASLEGWELTVARYGAATLIRPPGVLLGGLTADFADLQRMPRDCRAISAVRRLTPAGASASGRLS